MSVVDANQAAEAFLDAMRQARDMARAGRIGAEFDDLLRHAQELLEIVDAELTDLDCSQHADLFAAASLLRQKLDRLRNEPRAELTPTTTSAGICAVVPA